MSWSQFSLRQLLLVTVLACVVGFSTYRVQQSRRGRLATYEVWALDGKTAGCSSRIFVSPNSGINRISLTMNHGFWTDLLGFDHTCSILLPKSEYNAPIDDTWIRKFESAIRRLPYLRIVLVERDDFTDEMIQESINRYDGIQFERHSHKPPADKSLEN